MAEVVDLWKRNLLDLVRELLENSRWKDCMQYQPQKLYEDKEHTKRIYHIIWTSDWWIDKYVYYIYICKVWKDAYM